MTVTNDSQETPEATTVVINPSNPVNVVSVNFYREDVPEFCQTDFEDESSCGNKAVWVHREDESDVVCTTHRMEISPRRRKEFVKIEAVPSNKLTSEDLLAEAVADVESIDD